MIVDYLPLKRDTQITIFDYERAVVLDVANRVAQWFNRRYQFDFWTSTDVESEAQLIALEYYQKDDYSVSRLRSTIRFELFHHAESIDKDLQRKRRGVPTLQEVAPQFKKDAAFAIEDLPLPVVMEIGEIIATFTPPVAAALTDIINGYTHKEAAKRNNISASALSRKFAEFRQKMENVI